MRKKILLLFLLAFSFFLTGCTRFGVRPYANDGYVLGVNGIRYSAHFFSGEPYIGGHVCKINDGSCTCVGYLMAKIINCQSELTLEIKSAFFSIGFIRNWDTFFDTQQLIITPFIGTALLNLDGGNPPTIINIAYENGALTVNLQLRYFVREGQRIFLPLIAYMGIIEITRIPTLVEVVYTGGEFETVGWDEYAIEIFMLDIR